MLLFHRTIVQKPLRVENARTTPVRSFLIHLRGQYLEFPGGDAVGRTCRDALRPYANFHRKQNSLCNCVGVGVEKSPASAGLTNAPVGALPILKPRPDPTRSASHECAWA